jgi:hypothetical protein
VLILRVIDWPAKKAPFYFSLLLYALGVNNKEERPRGLQDVRNTGVDSTGFESV